MGRREGEREREEDHKADGKIYLILEGRRRRRLQELLLIPLSPKLRKDKQSLNLL